MNNLTQPNISANWLSEMAKIIADFSTNDPQKSYSLLLKLLNQMLPYQYASLFYLDNKSQKLQLIAQKGKSVDLIKQIAFKYGNGLSAWVLKENRHVLLDNLHYDKPDKSEDDIHSFLAYPLVIEKKMVGVINFAHTQPTAFTHEMLETLHTAAPMIAVLVLKYHFVKNLSDKNLQLAKLNNQLILNQQKRIQKEKKALLSATVCSINHEVNNPLMIASGNLQLLLRKDFDPETTHRLQIVNSQLDRIANIMQQLRSLENISTETYLDDNSSQTMLSLNCAFA